MKFCFALILLVVAVAKANFVPKSTKYIAVKPNTATNIKRNENKPTGVKPKQTTSEQLASKAKQQKPKAPNQNLKASSPNLKRWLPKANLKKQVKYTLKIVNNTKRWMPAFADYSNEMESSMMYDTGYVGGGGDVGQPFARTPQQSPSMFQGAPQESIPGVRNAAPEQNFLLPEADDNFQSTAPIGRPEGPQYQQNFGGDIESFTKDVSGLTGAGDTTDYSALENIADSNFMNTKFQEGDYLGASLQQSKQPNLYDSFSFEPTFTTTQNFAPKARQQASLAAIGSQDSKTESSNSKAASNDEPIKQAEPKQTAPKQAEVVKTSSKTDNATAMASKDSASDKSDKESGQENAKETVHKATKEEVKEANNDADGKSEKTEGKEAAAKEKNDAGSDDADEKQAGKVKENSEEVKPSTLKSSKLVETKKKQKSRNNAKAEENQTDKEKDSDENTVSGTTSNSQKEKVVDNKKSNQKDDSSNENANSIAGLESSLKTALTNDEDKNNNEEPKENNNINRVAKVTHSHKQQAVNVNNKDSKDNKEDESKQATNLEQQNEQQDDDKDGSEQQPQQQQHRIRKLKQRIHIQKQSRHQASAAERYQITSDDDKATTDSSLASNVSPAKLPLSFAAGQLRKQLVTNLRQALMNNVAAAMAHRKNVQMGGRVNLEANNKQLESSPKPNNMKHLSDNNEDAQSSTQSVNKPMQQDTTSMSNQETASNKPETQESGSSQEGVSQGSASQGGASQGGLVPTLMKMDKTMLIDTIVKLLKKNAGNKQTKQSMPDESSQNQKQMTSDSENAEKNKEESNNNNINQSFNDQEQPTPEATQQQGHAVKSSQENSPGKPEAQTQVQAESDGQQAATADAETKQAEPSNQDENGHSEFAAYPVKSQEQGDTKFYKFRKLKKQEFVKMNPDDPYAQIGLVDPSNNDKVQHHHTGSKTSDLKQDLEKQTDLVSKFVAGNDASNEDTATSKQDDKKVTDQPQKVQQTLNADQQSANLDSSEQQKSSPQIALNQKPDKEIESSQAPDQQQDSTKQSTEKATANPDSDSQPNQQASANSDSDSQSNTGDSQQSNQQASTSPNSDSQSSKADSQQSSEQATANPDSDSRSTKATNEEQSNPQQSDEQSQAAKQPEGVTVESHVNADSPQVLAQLNKISDRLHNQMAKTGNNKPNQDDGKEAEQQVNNGQISKNFVSAFSSSETIPDDAYASIGSFDPNVKKKASIGKKRPLKSI